MPNYGSPRCVGCGGEDCVCCEVYLEDRAPMSDDDFMDGFDGHEWDDESFEDDCDVDCDNY